MSPEEEKCLIDTYLTEGWVVELNEGKHLWFSKYIDENTEWMRDYNKETGSVHVFNGRQKVNLRVAKEPRTNLDQIPVFEG